jgi:hypothetical protein
MANAMAIITDFRCLDEDENEIPCDAFGNNVALRCPSCGYPMLAIIRENQRVSGADNPAICRGCDFQAWLSVDTSGRRLRLHRPSSVKPRTGTVVRNE